MFRFHKTLDVITLFHKAGSPASIRVQTLLKQISASSSVTATLDQASEPPVVPKRDEFELEITEEPPTPDQLKSILEYIGISKSDAVIRGGARNESEAIKKLSQSADNFLRPVTVDWANGKAVAGDDKPEILKILKSLPKA